MLGSWTVKHKNVIYSPYSLPPWDAFSYLLNSFTCILIPPTTFPPLKNWAIASQLSFLHLICFLMGSKNVNYKISHMHRKTWEPIPQHVTIHGMHLLPISSQETNTSIPSATSLCSFQSELLATHPAKTTILMSKVIYLLLFILLHHTSIYT